MEKILYSDARSNLKEKFPEFLTSKFYSTEEEDITYVLYESFSEYLTEIIKTETNPIENPIVKKAFAYLNEMVSCGDKETKNLAFAGVFENLIKYKITVVVAKHLTTGEAAIWFNDFRSWFKEPQS